MNFLAHIYLSGKSDLVKIGNFMADGVHGNKFLELHSEIQKGIVLHRFIDTFTDAHPYLEGVQNDYMLIIIIFRV